MWLFELVDAARQRVSPFVPLSLSVTTSNTTGSTPVSMALYFRI